MELDHVKEEETERRENAVGVVREGSKFSNLGNFLLKGASKGSCHQIEAT